MALARAKAAVLVPSAAVPDTASVSAAAPAVADAKPAAPTVPVRGYDFNEALRTGRVDHDALLSSYSTTGFQATNLAKAVDQINDMVRSSCNAHTRRPVMPRARRPLRQRFHKAACVFCSCGGA
jgi:hypothetical protein